MNSIRSSLSCLEKPSSRKVCVHEERCSSSILWNAWRRSRRSLQLSTLVTTCVMLERCSIRSRGQELLFWGRCLRLPWVIISPGLRTCFPRVELLDLGRLWGCTTSSCARASFFTRAKPFVGTDRTSQSLPGPRGSMRTRGRLKFAWKNWVCPRIMTRKVSRERIRRRFHFGGIAGKPMLNH